jgi:hypothetical protein
MITIVLLFDWTILFYRLLEVINKFPLILFLLILSFIGYQIFSKKEITNSNKEHKWLIFFVLIGLSGTFPMMLSQKQAWFYIITTLPFFSIALGILIAPIFHAVFSRTNKLPSIFLLAILLFFLGPFASTSKTFLIPYTRYITFNSIKHQFNTIARDKPLIEDIKLIIGEVPKNTILSIDFEKNWSTHSYFARYKNISLDVDRTKRHKYLVSFEKGWNYDARTGKYIEATTIFQESQKIYNKNYKRVQISTNKLHLYEYEEK